MLDSEEDEIQTRTQTQKKVAQQPFYVSYTIRQIMDLI